MRLKYWLTIVDSKTAELMHLRSYQYIATERYIWSDSTVIYETTRNIIYFHWTKFLDKIRQFWLRPKMRVQYVGSALTILCRKQIHKYYWALVCLEVHKHDLLPAMQVQSFHLIEYTYIIGTDTKLPIPTRKY